MCVVVSPSDSQPKGVMLGMINRVQMSSFPCAGKADVVGGVAVGQPAEGHGARHDVQQDCGARCCSILEFNLPVLWQYFD